MIRTYLCWMIHNLFCTRRQEQGNFALTWARDTDRFKSYRLWQCAHPKTLTPKLKKNHNFSLKVLLKRVNVNVYSRARIFSEDSKDRAKYIVSIMDSSSGAIRWTTSSVTEGWSLATIISTLPCQKKSQFDLLSSRRGKSFWFFAQKHMSTARYPPALKSSRSLKS